MRQNVLEMTGIEVYRRKQRTLNIRSLQVAAGEMVAVVGPNGSGKSTLLQLVNMHLPYKAGTMYLFGEDAAHIDKQAVRRRCSLVFQETLLLNDTVFNNVALALRFRGMAEKEVTERVNAALTEFRCAHLADRMAGNLSGGEGQRVSLARALVYQPELLLLDEPFAALDAFTRRRLLADIREIAAKNGTTVMLVSHSFNDVLYFAERAIVMQSGDIIQDDKPEVILRRPVNEVVASLVEMDNIIPCQIKAAGDACFVKLSNGIEFPCSSNITQNTTACCLPGDALYIWNEQLEHQIVNWVQIQGNITHIIPGIGMYRVIIESQGLSLTVRVLREQVTGIYDLGMKIKIAFNPEEAHMI